MMLTKITENYYVYLNLIDYFCIDVTNNGAILKLKGHDNNFVFHFTEMESKERAYALKAKIDEYLAAQK